MLSLPVMLILSAPMAQTPLFTAQPGDRFRDQLLARGLERIESRSPATVTSAEEARRLLPVWRQKVLESLGLWPLPERTELRPRVTRSFTSGEIKVENIVFESAPGLYVTGNFCTPLKRMGPIPAVLYVCGHATEVRTENDNGSVRRVAYGSKVPYQHHGRWLAEHGFACLTIDTLQLGEIEGLHHGTYREGMWWWQSRGYTPAGVELWNAMRALDYLQGRPEVDPNRLGVTGRSGGGATSWWLASTDERVKAAVPVAGIGDLRAHVFAGEQERFLRGCVTGHCDCMFFHNVGGLDYSHVIALCAPRPVLLGNSDADPIFPVGGYRRPAEAARQVYKSLGAENKLALMETKGGHTDTEELRDGAFRWFKRWLKDDLTAVTQPVRPKLDAKELKVFKEIPKDQRNTTAHEWFVPEARHPLPISKDQANQWLDDSAPQVLRKLREQTFGAWPSRAPFDPPRLVARAHFGGTSFERFDLATETGLWLPILIIKGPQAPSRCELRLLDQTEWDSLGLFQAIERGNPPASFQAPSGTVVVMLPCRGIGPTRWNDIQPLGNKATGPFMMERRLALLGETSASGRVWDIVRVAGSLGELPSTTGLETHVVASGELAACAAHAMLFAPTIRSAWLVKPPTSHRNGPAMLHVMRFADLPQVVGMAAAMGNRHIKLVDSVEKDWQWALKLTALTGRGSIKVQPDGMPGS